MRIRTFPAVATAAMLLLVGPGATDGRAEPGTAAGAHTQLLEVSAQLRTVSGQYAAAQQELARRTAAAAAATARAAAAARAVAGYRGRISQLVGSESRSDRFGTFGAMMSSDSPGSFAARASLIDVVSRRRAAVLAAATAASTKATKARAEARAEADAAAKLTRELAAKRADLTRRAAASKALYDRLSAAERRAFLAAAGTADPPAAAPAPAPAAAPAAASVGSRATRTGSPAPVPASGRAAAAVASARAQLGDPYVWGATGPGSFDCSGLTQYAWAAAGVSIPRNSRAQYAAGHKVSRASLRAGDLVFFGSPIYHVAMYLGGGMIIAAPQPGDVVKVQSLNAFRDYTGATRPG